ncbi:MAG: chemotaxis protein CheW [Pirellulales bacterium]|nr:chemotaxis protein CheW [Pirellulales bacterium]
MSPLDDSQIIADFVVESREHLADIENQFLAIEEAGADIDDELVNTVFRAIHSIKGAAGFLGFSTVGQLSHEMENVLNLVRSRQLVPTPEVVDVLLRAADTLRHLVESIESSNGVDVSGHVSELQQAAAGKTVSPKPAAEPMAAAAPTSPKETLPPEETPSLKETPPPIDAIGSAEQSIEEDTMSHEEDNAELTMPAASWDPPTAPGNAEAPSAPAPTGAPPDTNIRVAVSVLDHLMNLAGELVLSRNQLLQTVNSTDQTGLDSVAARVDQVTSELQETIMQTRMQVIGTIFQKFPRVVRDLSNQLGKQCKLVIDGKDVELDKSIIEAIGDPLTHLIRNAVDHGIERPEVRATAGKNPEGTIALRAFHQAGKVNIAISDDGAGIDARRLKEKAVTRGLITPEQSREMSDREALRLIFHPGFSMAEKVTDVSGRGVGMDVVKTNIEKLGGAVGIETRLGAGTTIDVKLPLTLAIVPSLVVRSGSRRFAIPQASISELVRIKANDSSRKIERLNDAEVFRLRGTLLPLVRLGQTLKAAHVDIGPEEPANGTAGKALNIIVVETGHLRYGLIVDGLHDSEEIVVKPLGRHMQNSGCLAGATILGDGEVALILDVTGIATYANLKLANDDATSKLAVETAVETDRELQTVLLFRNGTTERFAIPMELIARLERIRGEQIDTVGGSEVLQYRGTTLPLLRLENHITAMPGEEVAKMYVVVFKVMRREVGLIVPRIEDIRNVATDVDVVTFREPGVIGAIVVDDKTTRMLDLYELTEAAHPDWFAERDAAKNERTRQWQETRGQERTPRVLLVEDSGFFRAQVTGFLEGDGYHVTGAEDGQIAWNLLKESAEPFDLVLTDIEMPNMDGCELAQAIRGDPALAHLPIVALTSLASEEDMQRGMESGIDDYQIKLDRERLMASVARHLHQQRSESRPEYANTAVEN